MRGPKDYIDAFGGVALTGFSALLAFNQVVIKVSAGGFQPVFLAGLRSAGAILCLWLLLRLRGVSLGLTPQQLWPALSLGGLFAMEFLLLYQALDLTTVARASILFYTMPIWMAVGAHFLISGQRLTPVKLVGLALAFAGVSWALLVRPSAEGAGHLLGDVLALAAAMCWAAIALLTRTTSLTEVRPVVQIFYQVLVSAPLLILAALAFGPFIRDVSVLSIGGLAFQIALVSIGFPFWIWLLSLYPPAGVASFAFLGPVFGVVFGWALLGEPVGPQVVAALVLVAAGLILINRRARPQVPQNV